MLTEHFAPSASPAAPRFFGAPLPAWFMRRRLARTDRAIAELERVLDAEFGLLETWPLHEELRQLRQVQAETAATLAPR